MEDLVLILGHDPLSVYGYFIKNTIRIANPISFRCIILRIYYNFCFAYKSNRTMETPAQQLGLTDKKFYLKDMIYQR